MVNFLFVTAIRKEKREKLISSKRFRFEEGEDEENDITSDQVNNTCTQGFFQQFWGKALGQNWEKMIDWEKLTT